jgi:hypothetical protein
MKSFLALGFLAFAQASSRPDGTLCDAMSKTMGDGPEGVYMEWVKAATRGTEYTIRTGDDCTKPDPTTWRPGEKMFIYVRTVKPHRQFRGFQMYAVDKNERQVGSWIVKQPTMENFYMPANCGDMAGYADPQVFHSNGNEKEYFHTFIFQTPPAGTGKIYFRTLIKRGVASVGGLPSGEFYHAMSKDLSLDEASARTSVWVQGNEGESCTQTCSGAGKTCNSQYYSDLRAFQTRSDNADFATYEYGQHLFDNIARQYACHAPLQTQAGDSCGQPGQDADEWCYTPGATCPALGCDTPAATGIRPFCACGGAPPSVSYSQLQETSQCAEGLSKGSALSPAAGTAPALRVFTGLLAATVASRSPSAAVAGLFAAAFLLPTAEAHNWLGGAARSTNNAATMAPCKPRSPGVPAHYQIGPNQRVPVEWATGHSGWNYIVAVYESDFDKLLTVNNNDLLEYIEGAPVDLNLQEQWQRHAVNANEGPLPSSYPEVIHERLLTPADSPTYIVPRPEKNVVLSGRMNLIYQWKYRADSVAKDGRASYLNPKWPWIIEVARYWEDDTTQGRASELDAAQFTIDQTLVNQMDPTKLPGKFLFQWRWAGYYDCVDVDVFTTPVANMFGRPPTPEEAEAQWEQLDHCMFEEAEMLMNIGVRQALTTIQACKDLCSQTSAMGRACDGVNLMPLKYPKTVLHKLQNWQMDHMKNVAYYLGYDLEKVDDPYVCYPLLARQPNSTHPIFTISRDPRSPIFYGTCYLNKASWVFDTYLPGDEPTSQEEQLPPVPPPYRFSDKCIPCETQVRNEHSHEFPRWKLSTHCEVCPDPTNLTATTPVYGHIVSQSAQFDGFDYIQRNSQSANLLSPRPQYNFKHELAAPPPPGWVPINPDTIGCRKRLWPLGQMDERSRLRLKDATTLDECLLVASQDPECSDYISYGNSDYLDFDQQGAGPVMCDCWKSICQPATHSVAMNNEWASWTNIYRVANEFAKVKADPDPTCSKGVKSADSSNCCPKECGVCAPDPTIKISFQVDPAPVKFGHVADNGALYGARAGGLNFGWTGFDQTANMRSKEVAVINGTVYPQGFLQDGFVSVNANDAAPTDLDQGIGWEIDVTNGQYRLDVLHVPLENRGGATTNGCTWEGEIRYGQNDDGRVPIGNGYDAKWYTANGVTVSDGRLTLTMTDKQCNGIAAVLITPQNVADSSNAADNCFDIMGACCPQTWAERSCSEFEAPCQM